MKEWLVTQLKMQLKPRYTSNWVFVHATFKQKNILLMDTYHACAPDDIITIKNLNLFHDPPYEESYKDCKKNLHDSQSTIFLWSGSMM